MRMTTINPAQFKIDLELRDWELSKHFQVVRGVVVYDLSGRFVDGDKFKGVVLSLLHQHGHILIRTSGYNICIWATEKKRGHV